MIRNRKLLRGLLAGGLTAALTAGVAFASIGTGTVTAGSSLRLRAQPSTASSTLAIAPYKASVDVLENAGNGWYKVSYRDMEGYMSGDWLAITLDGDADTPQAPAETGYVNAGPLNVRSGPGTGYSRIGSLSAGTAVTIAEKLDGWFKITGGGVSGYVSAVYITLGAAPSAAPSDSAAVSEKGYVNASALNVRSGPGTGYGKIGTLYMGAAVTITEKLDGWYKVASGSVTGYVSAGYITLGDPPAASGLGAQAAALARQQVGKRYVYGATGPYAFDCSGLIYYIYRSLGVSMARGASSQYYNNGYFVSANLNAMQPGDLLFFFDRAYDSSGGRLPVTHVGIYVGNNQFVHASTARSGVRLEALFGGYHGPHLVGVKRIG